MCFDFTHGGEFEFHRLQEYDLFIWYTSWVQQPDTHKFHRQLVAKCRHVQTMARIYGRNTQQLYIINIRTPSNQLVVKFVCSYVSTDLQEVTSKKTVMSMDTMCCAFSVLCRAFYVLYCAFYVLGCAFYVLCCTFYVSCNSFYVLFRVFYVLRYSFYVLCILCVA